MNFLSEQGNQSCTITRVGAWCAAGTRVSNTTDVTLTHEEMVAGPPKAAVGSRFQTSPVAVVKSHGGERRGNGSDEI